MAEQETSKQESSKQETSKKETPSAAPEPARTNVRDLKKQKKEERKIKKALKCKRFRGFKNFCWWFFGCFCGVILFFAGIAAAILLLPVNTLTGGNNEGVVSDELASSTIGEIVFNLDKYGFEDLPIVVEAVKGITEGEVGKYVEVDYDKLNAIKFGSSNIAEELQGCIKVVATIEDTVGTETLGDLGNLSVFSEWQAVDGTIDESADTFNPKLYYYKPDVAPYSTAKKEYVRAYSDDGTRVAPAGATMYYAALAKVPMLDALDLIDESLSRLGIKELLTTLGGAEFDSESLIANIVGDNTIGSIGNITLDGIKLETFFGDDVSDTFKNLITSLVEGKGDFSDVTVGDLTSIESFDSVLVKDLLGEAPGDQLESLLKAITDKNDYSQITIGDLTGITSLDNVHVEGLLGDVTQETKDLLESITGEDYSDITVSDITGLDGLDDVPISGLLGDEVATSTKELLELITGIADYETITVGNLTSITSLDGINLSEVLGDSVSDDVKTLLKAITGEGYADITIGNLKNLESFSIDGLYLSVVMKGEDVTELKKILEDMFHAGESGGKYFDDITIGDLSDINFKNVHINTILPRASMSDTLVAVLEDEFGGDYENITLDQLNDFKLETLHLYKVLPKDRIDGRFVDVLKQMTSADNYEDILISDLFIGEGDEDMIGGITLSTLMDAESVSSPILKQLIKNGTTVGGLGDAINGLKIGQIYGDTVFKTVEDGGAPAGATRFSKNGTIYTENADGEYYLEKGAGIWLLIGFEETETADGIVYAERDGMTMGKLESGDVGTIFSSATIRQLINAGILSEGDYNEELLNMTLDEVILMASVK